MQTLRKLLVLAPVFLLAVTACEAKIDEAKAQERANGYKAEEVAEQYKSVDMESKLTINKNTGAFAEGGILYSELVQPLKELLNDSAEDGDPSTFIYTAEMVESLVGSVNNSKNKAEITYYSYKNTGLKISATSDYTEESEGLKVKGGSKMDIYILDDGRLEKAGGSSKMDVSGKYGGVEVKGSLNFTLNITLTWHKA